MRGIRFFALMLTSLAVAMWAHAEAVSRPNIVIILADDMGYGDLGCQNPDSKIPTPNLNRLASEGIRFTDAHSPSAVCSPTRYSILTGDYAWRSRLKQSVLWPWDEPLIDEDKLTLPGMLRERGYATACIGKWHLGWNWPTYDNSTVGELVARGEWTPDVTNSWYRKVDLSQPIKGGPTTRGFDYYFGDDVPNFPPYCFIENDRSIGIPKTQTPRDLAGNPGYMLADWDMSAVMPAITEKAVAYIRAECEEPYFLYVPLTAPHTPIAPTEEFIGTSGAHRYGDFVVEIDWTVGQILDAIQATGQADNTLVIFTSDNGSPRRDGTNMVGAVDSVLKYGHDPSYIYRGIKADIWEGGHRVPFLAKWPDHIPAGSVSNELICHIDLMATCAAITGAELPDSAAVDSYNILSALKNEPRATPIREAVVHHSIAGMFAIRQGKWKLIKGLGSGGWSRGDTGGTTLGQLYDLKADPGETRNLYRDEPEIVRSLSELLKKYRVSGRSVPREGSRRD